MQREYRIDNLRAVAILLVMLGHSIIIYDPDWGVAASSVQCLPLLYLKKAINVIQMPLFFSISGFCFCLSSHQGFSKKFLVGKFKRIMIPYLLVCLLYMDPIKILLNVPGYGLSSGMLLKQIALFMDNGHLWYLPTLFLMFMATSIMALKVDDKKLVYMLLPISILANIGSSLVPQYFSLNQFCNFYIYFLGGYFVCLYKNQVFNKRLSGVILVVLSMSVCLIFGNHGVIAKVVTLAFSLCAVVGFYGFMTSRRIGSLQLISKDSYGLYLFHSPLVYFMYMNYPDANPAIMLAVNFLVCGLVSFLVIGIIRKLRFELILGESIPVKKL